MLRKISISLLVIVIGLPLLSVGMVAFLLIYFDDSSGSLISSGETREYLLHVPETISSADPVPLVISLHAAFLTPASQRRYSEWNEVANDNGFIVVYPAGSGFPKLWRGISTADGQERERRFFNDLIDHLQEQFNIDPARIYLNGYSNGAAMSFILSCLLDDRIAAIGTVAIPVPDWDWCKSNKVMPMITFQGKLDPFTPYEGGDHPLANDPMQSVPDWARQWAVRNECDSTAGENALYDDVFLTSYSGCNRNADVELYTIVDGGHTWPGVPRMPEGVVGKTSESIHASKLMWDFFSKHTR